MKLTPMLDRKPLELSGGQQQRCALARALVKTAGMVLRDVALANLDYNLREDRRATLRPGRVTQFGPTAPVCRRPADATTARVFSDPPMNFLTLGQRCDRMLCGDGRDTPAFFNHTVSGRFLAGFRPNYLTLDPTPGAIRFDTSLTVTKNTGSETFVHLNHAGNRWVGLIHGVRDLRPGQVLPVYLDPSRICLFAEDGTLVAGTLYAKAA